MAEEKQAEKKKKWPWIIVGGAVLLFIVIGAVGSNNTTQNTGSINQNKGDGVKNTEPKTTEPTKPVATAPSKAYVQVFAFSGNGQKKSEPFTIVGDRFKVKYNCNGDLCQAWASKVGSGYSMESIMNTTQAVKDETVIYGSGEWYIESNSLGTWSMTVEDYK